MRRWGHFAVAGVLLASSVSVYGDRSKQWRCDNDVPAYGDSVPPESVPCGYRELDGQGIERDAIAPARTDEEIERERQLAAIRDEVARVRQEQEQKDQRLLELYPKLEDLLSACEGNLGRLDEQIRHIQVDLGRLQDSLMDLQTLAAEAERSGRPPSASLQANIRSVESRIRSTRSSMQTKEDEKAKVDEACRLDVKRYRELRPVESATTETEAASDSPASDAVENEVRCVSNAECQRFWEIAKEYAKRHATKGVALEASRIWASASPSDARDVGITVARLTGKREGEERIAMDVQCATTSGGEAFCLGPEVSAIRRNFRNALSKGLLD